MEYITTLLSESARNLIDAYKTLLIPALFFLVLAIALKGPGWIKQVKDAIPESELNLKILTFNVIVSTPIMAVILTFVQRFLENSGLILLTPAHWANLPVPVMLLIVLFVGDFIGYWRHRLEHTPLLWPVHAVHHSDTHMTWLTEMRWHPLNLLSISGLGGGLMLMLGFPAYAVLFNGMARHNYGYLIHSNLPWTYGPLGKIFVSPAMHRWHHSAESKAFDTNFAEFFCVFDRAFGTYYLPGVCDGPLGVGDPIEPTLRSQMMYPFTPKAYARLFKRFKRKTPLVPGE